MILRLSSLSQFDRFGLLCVGDRENGCGDEEKHDPRHQKTRKSIPPLDRCRNFKILPIYVRWLWGPRNLDELALMQVLRLSPFNLQIFFLELLPATKLSFFNHVIGLLLRPQGHKGDSSELIVKSNVL